jgi:hypothetical protein
MIEMNALLHGHHATLISWGREYEERKQQILENKPESEHAARLRCMQTLTPEMLADLPPALVQAWDAYAQAGDAYAQAGAAYDQAKAAYASELELWHSKHCAALRTPEGCPWDGERLVGIGD